MITFFSAIYKLEECIAIGGFTPIHYVTLKLHPEYFENNFPSGVEQYDKSIFIQTYVICAKYLGISPIYTMKIMILLEILGMVFLANFMLKYLVDVKYNHLCGLLLSSLLLASSARNISLANFGTAMFIGQFYNFVDLFRVVGIIFFFQQRYLFAFIAFVLALLTHPTQAVIAITCCCAGRVLHLLYTTIYSKYKIPTTNYIALIQSSSIFKDLAFMVTIACTILIFYLITFHNTHIEVVNIDLQTWFDLTKLGNHHWYPYYNGWLTTRIGIYVGSFCTFTLLLVHYFNNDKSLLNQKIISLMVTAIFLAIIGVIFSTIWLKPALIKIALFRSFDLIAILGLTYISAGLINDLTSKQDLGTKLLIILIIFMPFFTYYNPYLLVPSVLIARNSIIAALHNRTITIKNIIIYLSIILITYCIIKDQEYRIQIINSTLIIGPLFALRHHIKFTFPAKYLTLMPYIIVAACSIYEYKSIPNVDYFTRASSFLETQIWVKNNTNIKDNFFVDPSIYYGWRDFSERSSFGSVREWLHVSWLYDSNAQILKEGLARFKIFDINYLDYLNYSIAVSGFDKLGSDVQTKLYSMDTNWYLQIVKQYKLNYIVLQKHYMLKSLAFPVVHENHHFIVYKV
ncbi:MAG: hypothetical protein LN588_04995 [Rickettsia endosymbiont of Bryobia graminum]|nr:hypothetical protein [Rickettsia endosymbiont of Bryobia graminum]